MVVLHDAVDALHDDVAGRRLVLGPAADGGFYLVAARTTPAVAFADVTWSRDDVLAAVIARAEASGRNVTLLRGWHDVDTDDDLHALLRRAGGATRTRALLAAPGSPWRGVE